MLRQHTYKIFKGAIYLNQKKRIMLLNDSYLYNKFPKYEKVLFQYIMQSHEVDRSDKSFNDIRYEVKRRQVAEYLAEILDNENVVLMIPNTVIPKQFSVIIAKDIKHNKNKYKVYIDCTGIISYSNGKYNFKRIDILIAYLVQAMTCLSYGGTSNRLLLDNISLTQYGTEAYAKLFTTTVDYIHKISVTGNLKNKCMFLTALFYQVHMLGKELTDRTVSIAAKVSGVSTVEQNVIMSTYGMDVDESDAMEEVFSSIHKFVSIIARELRVELTLDTIVDKWMYLYGTGTVLGLELFTFFSAMMTNAYVGCYLNNQKTIENRCGTSMVAYSKELLATGSKLFNAEE